MAWRYLLFYLIFISFHIYNEALKTYFLENMINGALKVFIPNKIFCLTLLVAFLFEGRVEGGVSGYSKCKDFHILLQP